MSEQQRYEISPIGFTLFFGLNIFFAFVMGRFAFEMPLTICALVFIFLCYAGRPVREGGPWVFQRKVKQ